MKEIILILTLCVIAWGCSRKTDTIEVNTPMGFGFQTCDEQYDRGCYTKIDIQVAKDRCLADHPSDPAYCDRKFDGVSAGYGFAAPNQVITVAPPGPNIFTDGPGSVRADYANAPQPVAHARGQDAATAKAIGILARQAKKTAEDVGKVNKKVDALAKRLPTEEGK
ncbi:MAG: hypothetical protein RL141_629 [Candidatus Parcubacteria bacterium]|jgi:hypothetical protein